MFPSRYHHGSVDPTREPSANQSEDEDSERKVRKRSDQSETRKVASSTTSSFWDERNKREKMETEALREEKRKEKMRKMAGKAVLGGSLENFAYDEGNEEEEEEKNVMMAKKRRGEKRKRRKDGTEDVSPPLEAGKFSDSREEEQNSVSSKPKKRSKNKINQSLRMSDLEKRTRLNHGEQPYL